MIIKNNQRGSSCSTHPWSANLIRSKWTTKVPLLDFSLKMFPPPWSTLECQLLEHFLVLEIFFLMYQESHKYVASKDLHLSGCEMKKMIERKKYASVLPYYLWSALSLEKERIFFLPTKENNAKTHYEIFSSFLFIKLKLIPTINNE